jgi:hypothetical protein
MNSKERRMSQMDTHHPSPPSQVRLARPLRATAIVIYGTLLLLALAIPQGLVNWLKGFDPSKPQDLALELALAIQSVSNRLGADVPFSSARRAFLDATGKREE